TWSNAMPLYIVWADDNDSPSPDTANQIDNFSVVATPGTQTPVMITTQPQSQSINEFGSVSFTVALSGYLPPTLQWYSNDVAIPNATNLTYAISSAPAALNGVGIKVIAQNVANGETNFATSSVATLTVNADTT